MQSFPSREAPSIQADGFKLANNGFLRLVGRWRKEKSPIRRNDLVMVRHICNTLKNKDIF